MQRACASTLHCWWRNSAAVGGRKTLSMCSRSTTSTTYELPREAEWVRVRDQFFEHFLPHKEEALAIKERSPLGFMPLIEEQFWRTTGLHLHGLQDFTLWIKQGSYYHGLVAQQGQLQRCPHLVRVPLLRWSQKKNSESRQDSHKRAEALATGSSEPSAGATTAPAQETPAEELPVTETPASDTPHSDTPAPMETGGVGDGQSWAEQVKAGLEAELNRIGQRNVTGPYLGNERQDRCFPSPSKTQRGGSPPS